jgi:L-2-hydroxyglutarate oxidase LhgO
METVQNIVIGAGVVGLAVGRALAQSGGEVVVVEATDLVGSGASSRNSEVVHAGIYYPREFLKTVLCVRGRRLLYELCEARGVPYRKIGKLIVATREDDLETLRRYRVQAAANGVGDLPSLSLAEVEALEPEVRCLGALHSRETGIVDSHQLMLAIEADLEEGGGMVCLQSPFESAGRDGAGWIVRIGGEGAMELRCETLINCAGLGAQGVAHAMEGLATEHVPERYMARGQYYALRGASPFSRLVYPVAGGGGLGTHVTLDLAGQARFGPDVHWLEEEDYGFDESVIPRVAEDIRRYFPGLGPDQISPDYTGIRAKLVGPGASPVDFRIDGPETHGLPGLVNLFGIESPGLTAALAIAEHVVALRGLQAAA